MTGYRFLRPAEEEMTNASLFYDTACARLGAVFIDEVQHVISILRESPQLGQLVAPTLRRVLLNRFPFTLIYSVESDVILIVAVAHQRQRPDYWKNRV